MDIEALQSTLRTFAAERDWQPFHTPKNLSTALNVEAAKLAEIFQWMTPEQSMAADADVVVREQIADEVADVLLYLLQIADHTRVDLKRAVGRKLVKNAKKHQPLRIGLPAGTATTSTIETHVLVDWENVQPKEDDIRGLIPDVTDVWLFHGPSQKLNEALHASFGSRATPVKTTRSGNNALDFHLSFYMGYIASRHPDARFVVMSNDKGYGPMLEHAGELGFAARQIGFSAPKMSAKTGSDLSLGPGKKLAAKRAALKSTSTAKLAPTGEAEHQKAPAKTAAKKATTSVKVGGTKAVAKVPKSSGAAKSTPSKKAKGFSHVVASLKASSSKPSRQSRLLSTIKFLLGMSADGPASQTVLSDLVASGKVSIDEKGMVRYNL